MFLFSRVTKYYIVIKKKFLCKKFDESISGKDIIVNVSLQAYEYEDEDALIYKKGLRLILDDFIEEEIREKTYKDLKDELDIFMK